MVVPDFQEDSNQALVMSWVCNAFRRDFHLNQYHISVLSVAWPRNDVLAEATLPHESFVLARLSGENSDMNVQATEIAILDNRYFPDGTRPSDMMCRFISCPAKIESRGN